MNDQQDIVISEPLLLSEPEAMAMLRIKSRVTLLRWRSAGLLGFVSLPGRRCIRYERHELERFIASHRKPSLPPQDGRARQDGS